ncbi:MAG TPA: DUF4149 domain-containing protein [Steroidobacteraceae bacterium]|nr:DUF4149 domain-containing protein [Steroidobacteraceae bacterium]
MLNRVVLLIAVAWAGALWTICGLVAPTLFAILDDRRLAGQIAGTFFGMLPWIGLGAALLVGGLKWLMRRDQRDGWLIAWIAVAALLPLASELLLTPLMESARLAGDMARFGALHGFSAALFGGACVAAAAMLLRLTRRAA